jgi:hypothetical protein
MKNNVVFLFKKWYNKKDFFKIKFKGEYPCH